MKAQSELTGDRKRRAEMTRPRFGGVTKWMSEFDNMNIRETLAEHTAFKKHFDFGLPAVIDRWSIAPEVTQDEMKEVNHRPAAQQWTVCTP